MAATAFEALWEIVSHAGQTAVTHLGKRMDHAAGLDQPPSPPTPPGWQPPTWTPPPWQPPGTPPAVSSPPASPIGTSYSDQIAQGVACLACTRNHLGTVKTAAHAAATAATHGDSREAARQWAIVASELDALEAFDWSPDKLTATPPEDRAIVEAVRPCVMAVRQAIPTPSSVGLALGSAAENVRFATSSRFTERDAAEIQARHQAIDSAGNYAERVVLVSDTTAAGTQAKAALRDGRHVLDGAQDKIYAPETWAAVRDHFERAAVTLTPPPDPAQAQAVAAQCDACLQTFYREYFAAMKARRS